jgi:hypothetical protein
MTHLSLARRAVSYSFRLTCEHDALGEWFDGLVGALPIVDADEGTNEWLVTRAPGEEPARWCFLVDGEERGSSPYPDQLATTMIQTLNGQVVKHWSGVVAHAGCVSIDGDAILLPADPESGKTTLTCGLVRAGFSYVTDEGVAFRPGTSRIEPYPKPLSLDPGSWFLFPELEPEVPPHLDDAASSQWQVPPDAIRANAAAGPCDARYIVFPKYVEGADTRLTPIGRAEALVDLAKNTFEFNQHSREYLDQLAVVVEACDCYRLTVGTLDDAVACIQELVGAE